MNDIALVNKNYFIFKIIMSIVFVYFVSFLLLKVRYCKSDVINCNANLTIHRKELGLMTKLMVEFSMNNNNGVVYIDGVVYKNNEKIGTISRRTFFDITAINDDLLLISKRNWVTETNNVNESLFSELMLSKFYLVDDHPMAAFFTKNRNGSYYISTKTMPYVYCSKVLGDR
ncbi:hypothetical protein [Yersinia frederiksenii]|uniref:hypothetical protein n=1 Tax=Yersinia frederiksenii TaxID=29484 RepID=UPI0005E4E056|nr:hypothetical protein [Yersinia frederiksenii]CNL32875.1 Uncharacterised protein [Yersinia frederiksenii]